jgi:hypothetical protein
MRPWEYGKKFWLPLYQKHIKSAANPIASALVVISTSFISYHGLRTADDEVHTSEQVNCQKLRPPLLATDISENAVQSYLKLPQREQR